MDETIETKGAKTPQDHAADLLDGSPERSAMLAVLSEVNDAPNDHSEPTDDVFRRYAFRSLKRRGLIVQAKPVRRSATTFAIGCVITEEGTKVLSLCQGLAVEIDLRVEALARRRLLLVACAKIFASTYAICEEANALFPGTDQAARVADAAAVADAIERSGLLGALTRAQSLIVKGAR